MAENTTDANPLLSILNVLQDIHQEFKEQRERLAAVEEHFHGIGPRHGDQHDFHGHDHGHEHDHDCEHSTESHSIEGDSSRTATDLAGMSVIGSPALGELTDHFPYSSTEFGKSDPGYIPRDKLVEHIGNHAWSLPEDGRVKLSFTKRQLEDLNTKSTKACFKHLEDLQQLDKDLKTLGDKAGDFCVIDVAHSNLAPNIACYRLGEKGNTSEDVNRTAHPQGFISADNYPSPFQTPPPASGKSPGGRWRRYIYCQGLPSMIQGNAPNDDNPGRRNHGDKQGSPDKYNQYLIEDSRNNRMLRYVRDHVFSLRKDKLNQKRNLSRGNVDFHAVFYEIVDDKMESKEKLKEKGHPLSDRLGWLFQDPKARMLRRSAVTISAKFNPPNPTETSKPSDPPCPPNPSYWTILMMMPSGFLPNKKYLKEEPQEETKSPMGKKGCCGGFALSEIQHFQVAMLEHIIKALQKIHMKSRKLSEFMEELVFEGTSFLDTESYFELLFDDDTFSRSKRLFWAAASLDEFEKSLASTLEQWRKYEKVHIAPLLEGESFQGLQLVKDLVSRIEEVRQALEATRKGFEKQRVHVLALRDGVHNASSVMESRESTRLGQNVKLLTYINIFYLPLAFCAALWAIPNINDSSTQTPFIVTAVLVGLITYIMMFNLNNLIYVGGNVYKPFRSKYINHMNEEPPKNPNDSYKPSLWNERGVKLNTRLQRVEYTTPSEWWLLFYLPRYMVRKISAVIPKGRWFVRGRKDNSKPGEVIDAEKGL